MGRIGLEERSGLGNPWSAAGLSLPLPRRSASFRLHLVAMLLAALLPACLSIAIALRQEIDEYRSTFREQLEAAARTAAQAIDAELYGRINLAAALAAMATDGQALTLDERLRAVAERLGTGVFIYGPPPRLENLASSRQPPGVPLPPAPPNSGPADAVPRIFAEGTPQIGRGWFGPFTGRWLAGAYAPATIAGQVTAAIGVGLDLERLGRLLESQLPRRHDSALLVDHYGTILARSASAQPAVGERLPDWILAEPPRGQSGILFGNGPQGVAQIHGFARPTHAPGWLVLVSIPLAEYEYGWRGPTAPLILGAILALLAGAALAMMLARRCLRPVAALTERAAGIIAGLPPDLAPPPSAVREFALLANSLTAAHAALQREAAAARHERELLQSVIDGTPDMVKVVGLDGRTLVANAAAHAFFRLPPGALVGLRVYDLLPEALAARARRHDAAALRAGRAVTEEYNGRLFTDRCLVVTKVPWRDPAQGKVAGIITVIQDVTEQRRTEAELRRAEDEMQRLGRRATATVLASGLAHELNQPLTAATNYLRAAERLAAATPDLPRLPLLRDALRGAAEQTLRAGEIIRRLRDFMTRRNGGAVPEPLGAVVEEGVRLALGGLETAGLHLRVEVEEALAGALVDRVAVQQVLVNLVRNAMEAMRGLPQRELTVTATRRMAEGGWWIDLAVGDTGPGLPAPVRERLFEPFVSTKPDGMGVGLAICQRIAEACGGGIAVAAAAGSSGTVFTLSLPLVPSLVPSLAPPSAEA